MGHWLVKNKQTCRSWNSWLYGGTENKKIGKKKKKMEKKKEKKRKNFLLMSQCNDYIGYTNLDMDGMIYCGF